MTYVRHIVVALGLFLLPAVALAGPHVDEGAATEDLRQRLGADGPRWKLLVVAVQDDPTSRQVVVVSDDGDELVGTVSVQGLSSTAATARVVETAVGLVTARQAALDAEQRQRELDDEARRERELELQQARERRIEQERLRELDARERRAREQRQAQEAALAAARRRPEIRGFAGATTRTSLGGGGGIADTGVGFRSGAWLADDHVMPVVEGLVTFGSDGDYLATYGGRVGAGVFGGASFAKGLAWAGAGVTPHVHWDRSRQVPGPQPVRFDTEIAAILQARGKGHLGVRIGIDVGRPVTLFRRGDASIDRGAVRFVLGVTYGGSFPVRKARK